MNNDLGISKMKIGTDLSSRKKARTPRRVGVWDSPHVGWLCECCSGSRPADLKYCPDCRSHRPAPQKDPKRAALEVEIKRLRKQIARDTDLLRQTLIAVHTVHVRFCPSGSVTSECAWCPMAELYKAVSTRVKKNL